VRVCGQRSNWRKFCAPPRAGVRNRSPWRRHGAQRIARWCRAEHNGSFFPHRLRRCVPARSTSAAHRARQVLAKRLRRTGYQARAPDLRCATKLALARSRRSTQGLRLSIQQQAALRLRAGAPPASAVRPGQSALATRARGREVERLAGLRAVLAVLAERVPVSSRGSKPRAAGSCFRRHWGARVRAARRRAKESQPIRVEPDDLCSSCCTNPGPATPPQASGELKVIGARPP